MIDLETIKEKYQEMLTDDLIRLSKKPKDLRADVIPILKTELIRRGKRDDAATLEILLSQTSELDYQNMSLIELREMVKERVNAGEAMDSIKIDLRLNGIDVFELLKEEVKLEEEVYSSITQMKQDGASNAEIDTHLKNTYDIEKSDAGKLKSELKIKGKRNQNWDFILITVSCLILFLMFLSDEYRGLKLTILLLISGVTTYILGGKQAKD